MRTKYWKSERKIPLGRRRSRWEDNIKMNLMELGLECVNLINLTQDRD
jgi:hypothetical protein